MIIKTARFGNIKLEEKEIVTFVNPILGFKDTNRFVIVDSLDGEDFQFFQSIDDEHLTFLITDPFIFNKKYEFDMAGRWLQLLKLVDPADVLIKVIVTVRSSIDISINLKAPIIINSSTNEATQIILDGSEYSTRYPLFGGKEEKGSDGEYADPIKK